MFRRKYWKVHSSYKNLEVTRIDENGEEIRKNISYLLQFIDSARFMAVHYQVLSVIILNEFIELNVNLDAVIKKYETCGIKY